MKSVDLELFKLKIERLSKDNVTPKSKNDVEITWTHA